MRHALLASGTDGRSLLALPGQRRPRRTRIMRMQLRTFLVLIAVLALGLPAAAHASGAAVIRDCAADGKLNKTYSQKDLQSADKNLPSDIDEYTDCRSVIFVVLLTPKSKFVSQGPSSERFCKLPTLPAVAKLRNWLANGVPPATAACPLAFRFDVLTTYGPLPVMRNFTTSWSCEPVSRVLAPL